MSTLNKAMIIGRVGADPHTFQFENGGSKAELSIATNETFVRKETGEKITTTEWHKVVVNGEKRVEIIEKYVKKGDLIYIEGRIKTRKWTDQSGVDKYTTEIHCDQFTFLSPKGSNDSSQSSQSQTTQKQQNHGGDEFLAMQPEEETDDLPF